MLDLSAQLSLESIIRKSNRNAAGIAKFQTDSQQYSAVLNGQIQTDLASNISFSSIICAGFLGFSLSINQKIDSPIRIHAIQPSCS